MVKKVKEVRCEDYIDCEGCPLKRLVEMDRYDDNNIYIGKEEIMFCAKNGEPEEIFKKDSLENILDG